MTNEGVFYFNNWYFCRWLTLAPKIHSHSKDIQGFCCSCFCWCLQRMSCRSYYCTYIFAFDMAGDHIILYRAYVTWIYKWTHSSGKAAWGEKAEDQHHIIIIYVWEKKKNKDIIMIRITIRIRANKRSKNIVDIYKEDSNNTIGTRAKTLRHSRQSGGKFHCTVTWKDTAKGK